MIGIRRVPVEGSWNRSLRYTHTYNISHIGCLLRMNGHQIVDRTISGYNDGTAGNNQAVLCLDTCGRPTFKLRRMSCREYLSALPQGGGCQTRQVLKRMKLCLARKAQSRAGIKRIDWRAINFFHF